MSRKYEEKISDLESELSSVVTSAIGYYFKSKLESLREVMGRVSTDPRQLQRNKAAVILRMEIDRLNWVVTAVRSKPEPRDLVAKKNRGPPPEPRLHNEARPLKNMSTYYDDVVGKFGKPHTYDMLKDKEMWAWHEGFLDDFPEFTAELHKKARAFLAKCKPKHRESMAARNTRYSRYLVNGVLFKEPFEVEKPKKKRHHKEPRYLATELLQFYPNWGEI